MKALLSAILVLLVAHQSTAFQPKLDQKRLEQLHRDLESDRIEDVHAVIVDYQGERMFERYYTAPDQDWGNALGDIAQKADRKHDLRSVSKTVAALALGIALGSDWQTDLARPLPSYFPAYKDKLGKGVAQVTLADALTMRAGLKWNEMTEPYGFAGGRVNEKNDEIQLYQTKDPLGLVIARDVITLPGAEWYYNGGLTQIMGDVIQVEAGMPFHAFVTESLFKPMGIEDFDWRREETWPASAPPAIASGLRLKPTDFAKIGTLILDRGMWNGKQLVDAAWVDAVTHRHVATIPWFRSARRDTGYGFQTYRGRLDGQDVIFGAGNGDQRTMVFPALDLVITIMSGNYNDFSQPTGEIVAGAVLEALDTDVKRAALETEIWTAVERRNETWRADDFAGHMALYHPGFRRWAINGDTIFDRESFSNLWDRFKGMERALSIKVLRREIQWLVPGKAAVAHYRIDEQYKRNDEGEVRQGNLRFSDIFLLHEGNWLYAGGHRDGMAFQHEGSNQ